jgi:hydroxyacylglutathione hydrolase
MFLECVHSEGLAHLSYILGSNGEAAAIDPRRDCQIYVDIARQNDAAITYIFETHRNEDYVIGSHELSIRTGAQVHHGKALDFKYGKPVSAGEAFELGDIRLTVIETPGHTYESISLALVDKSFGDDPVAVFTGDALFIGDVGRTDFFPDKAEEVAGLLYESIFNEILPLGDHVILYPAHGAGSVCGSGMASREFSTLGYERKYNPILQFSDRQKFIAHKVNEHHYKPPYFRQMEIYNLNGTAPPLTTLPQPQPLSTDRFAKLQEDGMEVLDIRSPEAFAGAFIPGSLAMPLNMIPAFAGWFLSYETKIGLVANDYEQVQTAVRYLLRLGYNKVVGYLHEGLQGWETSGRRYDRIPAVHVEELVRRIQENEEFTVLDVRKEEEFKKGHLPQSLHVYVGELPDNLHRIPRDRTVTTFCGSGRRAIIASSILKRNGFSVVEDSLGSMAACSAVGCPIETNDNDH